MGACTVGLFEYSSTLMLMCAQPGRVTGSELKTDSASSEKKNSKKGFKDNKNRLQGIVNKFCIPFGTESTISNTSESTGSKNRRPKRHKMRKNLDGTLSFEKILSLHKKRFAL